MQGKIVIDGGSVTFYVIKAMNQKVAVLRMKPDASLEIRIPSKRNLDVNALIQKKRKWIERKYLELKLAKKILHERRILYKGKRLRVKVRPGRFRAIKRRGTLILFTRSKDWKPSLKTWMKLEAKRWLDVTVRQYSKRLNVSVKKITVKNTKRWGSASKSGSLNFSWQIISLPNRLAEYIVLHEVAHLKEMGHSKKYWRYVASFMPDYRGLEKTLKLYLPAYL